MNLYQLYRSQRLNLTQQQAWEFFSSPYHLNDITPAFFQVDITSKVPENIYGGLMLSYRMKAVFDIPMAWLSEISHCETPHRFVYQQRVGPFKFWSHEVCINECPGGVVVEDIVFYAMPLGWLGQCLHALLIGEKLNSIFDTRYACLQARWGLE